MITIPDSQGKISSKIDASIGLLANIPERILNKLRNKLGINETGDDRIELTILYRSTVDEIKNFIEESGGEFQDLGFNFAIIRINIDDIYKIAASDYVQYIELPKSLYQSDFNSIRASCVPQAVSTYNVSGKGVLVGFIDSGIDYTHPAFLDSEGNTRIEYIYDLSNNGAVYNKQQINEAIKSDNPYSIVPEIDDTGHGTYVTGVACGGGNIPNEYKGIALDASIAMVKGARGRWVLSSQIMKGIKFLLDKSKELNIPLVINMSLSTNNGAHNGSSLLEQYIRIIANLEKITIVIAAGNEGDASHHVGGELQKTQTESFEVASDEDSVVINFYKSILPEVSINIKGPSGLSSGNIKLQEGYFQGSIGRNRYDIYVSGPKPFELESEIQITLTPISSDYLVEGTWQMQIDVISDYEGRYSLWLPILEGLNPQTKFLQSNPFNTLGIPATVDNIIAVGSYNPQTNTLSSFSGRGVNNNGAIIRPDIVAPGENVSGPSANGGYDRKSGTSVAAPQVSGICALFAEWGLVKGNDPYLYGQRLKYYLVRGANRSRNDVDYPNPSWGYGTVCAFDSFYILENTLNEILSERTKIIEDYSKTRVTNYSQESFENLLDDIGKYDVNKDEIISFIIEISNKQEIDDINKIPDTSAIPISEFNAVVNVPIKYLDRLKKYIKETVIYYNPPVYTLTSLSPIEASGAPLFQDNPYLRLDGTGVLVAIMDTGVDYLNEEFMLEDDTTRIVSILDQTIEGEIQTINGERIFGTQYTEEQINQAIKLYKNGGDPYTIVPSKDENGHGTMTAGIIGGRGRNPDLRGAAPNCKFVIIKLKELKGESLNYSGVESGTRYVYGEPMMILALRYLSLIESEFKLPMVMYFPLGTNTGAHSGSGVMEKYFEVQSRKIGVIPVTGTGNQGDTQTHIEGRIQDRNDDNYIEVKVGKNQKFLNFNIYFSKPDKVSIGIVSPSGEVLEKVDVKLRKIKDYKFIYEGTVVSIYYLDPFIETGEEVAVLKFRDIREGIWKIRLYGERIIEGKYWSWLPQRELLDKDTRFINPIQSTTLTIPSTGLGLISSANYNQDLNTTVSTSGLGYARDGRIKPDIAAGGVNATVIKPGGGTTVASGSSVASSVLAGCCALILQWAITERNDPGVTLLTLTTYIISGAKMRQGDVYPNKEWGYGMLDIQNVFNSFRDKRINRSLKITENYIEFNQLRNMIKGEYEEYSIGKLFLRVPR